MADDSDQPHLPGPAPRQPVSIMKGHVDLQGQIVICDRFLRDGFCVLGDTCRQSHHHNLSPNYHKADKDFAADFTVSTDKSSKDCYSCASKGIKCDRAGRSDPDEPCTWCRFFGGPKHVCTPSQGNVSPNDAVWMLVLSRKMNDDRAFTVPEARFGQPMLHVKEGWTSAYTREQLLADPSNLLPPTHFRMHPRVYLQYPTAVRKVDNISNEQSGGRDTKRQKTMAIPTTISTSSIFSHIGNEQMRAPAPFSNTPVGAVPLQPATLFVGAIVSTKPVVGQKRRENFWRITYSCGTVIETPVAHPDPSGRFIPSIL